MRTAAAATAHRPGQLGNDLLATTRADITSSI